MTIRFPGSKAPWFPFAIGGAVFGALARSPSPAASRAERAGRPGVETVGSESRALPSAGQYDMGRRLMLDYVQGDVPTAGAPGQATKYTVDVLIATLPDPFDSHLDWIYDAHLDAIRRAFSRANYLPDRFWIPERGDSVTLKTSATSSSADRRVAAREVFPGVMLFRSADPKSTQLRLLYLVSELPTIGIYRDALVGALSERAALSRPTGELSFVTLDDRAPIRIVGPTFSGSVPSIERAIAAWVAEPSHQRDSFAIISGSITDSTAVERMASAAHVDFHTTIYPDYVAERFFRDSVIDRFHLAERGRVAILRETGTAYGGAGLPKDSGARVDSHAPIVVPFPLNIASLRAEYEKHPEPPPEHPISVRTPARIPLSLEDSARPKEEPPLRSAVTTATIDASISEIVGTLRDLEVSAVGIMATDIRDKLFLADLLHHRLPGVRLFTFEANRLYLRPEYSATLRGMLVVSTYPLVVQNQAWTDPQRDPDQLLAFATDGAEGTYNATLAQLDSALPLLEYRSPFDIVARNSVAPPIWISAVGGTSFVPLAALRVSAVGGKKFAPHFLRDTVRESISSHPTEEVPLGAPMPLVMVLWGALSAGILRVLKSAWSDLTTIAPDPSDVVIKPKSSTPTTEAKDEWFIEDLYQEVERISLELHRRLYAWLQVVALFALYVPFAATIYHTYWGRGWSIPAFLIIGVTSVVLLSLGISLAWGIRTLVGSAWVTRKFGVDYLRLDLWKKRIVVESSPTEDPKPRTRRDRQARWFAEVVGRFLVAFTGTGFLVLLSIFVADRMLVSTHTVAFDLFLFRSFRTGSGLSPITFIGLAGFGLVAWSEWHRRRIRALSKLNAVEQVAAHLRTGNGLETDSDGKQMAIWVRLADRVAEVRGRLFLLMPRTGSFFVGATLLVISLWLIPQFGPTFESIAQPAPASWWSHLAARSFDRLLVGCIVGSLWITVWTVYRFLAVWDALSRFLADVENTPLVSVFERLPESIKRMLQPSLFGGDQSELIEQAVSERVQQLSGLAQRAPTLRPKAVEASQHLAHAASRRRRTAASAGVVMEMERLTIRPDPTAQESEEVNPESLTELLRGLSVIWEHEPSDEGVRAPAGTAATSGSTGQSNQAATNPRRLSDVSEDKRWRGLAEEAVAVRIVEYIASVLRQIKRIAGFLLVALIATSLLISSYWFPSESMVTLVFMMILFGTVGSLIYVSLEANREELLSRADGSDPGKVTWSLGFVVNLTLIGVVPILLAVSSQFPAVRSALFAWVEPVLREILHN